LQELSSSKKLYFRDRQARERAPAIEEAVQQNDESKEKRLNESQAVIEGNRRSPDP